MVSNKIFFEIFTDYVIMMMHSALHEVEPLGQRAIGQQILMLVSAAPINQTGYFVRAPFRWIYMLLSAPAKSISGY